MLPTTENNRVLCCRWWARWRLAIGFFCPVVLASPLPLAVRADALDCKLEDALSQAAANLLLTQAALDSTQLTAAVREAGSDAVALHALVTKNRDPAAERAWLRELRSRADAELICGRAESQTQQLLVASTRAGSLAPISVERVVRGSLAVRFDRPELVIASADGSLTRVGATLAALAQGIALDRQLAAPVTVQLVARGPAGPRPVAERVVPAPVGTQIEATTPPASTSLAGRVPDTELGALLTELRRGRHLGPLRDNRLLRTAATAHARSVCSQGRVAHELEQGQGPEQRLASVGLEARLLGETIARASDANAALLAFERSPSHLLTLLERRFTDVGVGTAVDGAGKRCYVILLCAWPRFIAR